MIVDILQKTQPPKLLKDRFMLEARSLDFESHHFLYEIFNHKLHQYIEADLVNFHKRFFNERFNLKKFEEFKEPFAVLNLKELEAGFVVCLIPIILSLLVFAIEWLPTLKDLFVFSFIFQNYFYLKKVEQQEYSEFISEKIALWQAVLLENRRKKPE